MPETRAGPVNKKKDRLRTCFTASYNDGRTQAEDTGHIPNKGQSDPEMFTGHKLKTQAEDTA